MPIAFPASPTNGQLYSPGGGAPDYTYDSSVGVWKVANTSAANIAATYATIASLTAEATRADAIAAKMIGRNKLINSRFVVAQRGFPTVSSGGANVTGWVADRFQVNIQNGDTANTAIVPLNETDKAIIGEEGITGGLQCTTTGSGGANGYTQMTQLMESVQLLAGKTVTLSWWAKASVGTPIMACRLAQIFGSGGSPSATVTLAAVNKTLSTTMQKFSQTFVLPSVAGKTYGTDGINGTYVGFTLQAGATIAAQIGGQVQVVIITMTAPQLEIGSVATSFDYVPYEYELLRCQRFYQIIDVHMVANPTSVSEYISSTVMFPTPMRATPTITYGGAYVTATNIVVGGPTLDYLTSRGMRVYAQNNAVGVCAYGYYYNASAEIF